MSLVPPSHRSGVAQGLNPADSYERVAQRISLRQDSAENWSKNDPVLESGEFGYEIGYPTGKLKIGTGSTRWSELPYLLSRGPAGQPGLPGPAGPPGKGIQVKGEADVWPPAGVPEIGDLWILGDPLPPTAPAGSQPGDGYVWTGTKWNPAGPIRGPEGPAGQDGQPGTDGVDGESVTVFESDTAPTAIRTGDIWIRPVTAANAVELNVWNGTAWVPIAGSGGSSEPQVFTSDTAPPAPAGDALWVNTADNTPVTAGGVFTEDSPIVFDGAMVETQTDGTPIGLSADGLTFHQPLITGAIPVLIGGKKYLLLVADE
jgi:hypothetical protein